MITSCRSTKTAKGISGLQLPRVWITSATCRSSASRRGKGLPVGKSIRSWLRAMEVFGSVRMEHWTIFVMELCRPSEREKVCRESKSHHCSKTAPVVCGSVSTIVYGFSKRVLSNDRSRNATGPRSVWWWELLKRKMVVFGSNLSALREDSSIFRT